jgi:hypothetical protein
MQEFSVGGVLSDTIARLRTRFGLHFVYALVPTVLSAALAYLAGRNQLAGVGADPAARLATFFSPLYWVSALFSVLCSGWATAGVVGSMMRQPVTTRFTDIVPISVRSTLKYVVLFVVWYVLVGIGTIFLIIPGLIVITMFAAAVPALIDQDLGPWAALQESRRLTKGRRLAVLGTLVVFLLIIAVPSFVLLGVIGFNLTTLASLRETMPLVSFAMTVIAGPLYIVIVSALLVALYTGLGGQTRSDLYETFA